VPVILADAVIDPSSAASESGTETDLVTAAAAADRCASCNSPLASDQRYCIACGERRGKPRFAYQEQKEPAAAPTTKRANRRLHAPAGLQLIAGVATLLLAMGVGVLIGQNGNSNSGKAATSPAAQVITVNGGGGAAAASTTAASNSSSKATKSSKSKTKTATLTKKTTQAVNNGAASVVGTSAKLAAPTTKVGGKCTSGAAGCQNGTFTGNFFGGG